jgi:hypothetical protein
MPWLMCYHGMTQEQAAAFALSAPSFKLWDELRVEATLDPTVATLLQEIQDGLRDDKWAIVDDLVTQDGRIFISDFPKLCRRC